MTEQEYIDLRRWYLDTYINLPSWGAGLLKLLDLQFSSSQGEAILHVLEPPYLLDTTTGITPLNSMRITSLKSISPIPIVPKLVETGTRLGCVYLATSPRRVYKKSFCSDRVVFVGPNSGSVVLDRALAMNYLVGYLPKVTPEIAKERVLSGEALFSAITDNIAVGAASNYNRYVCTWKGRVVGSFSLGRNKEADVKHLAIPKSNGFLFDTLSAAMPEVICHVSR